MKKLILAVSILGLLFASRVEAAITLPPLQQGFGYSIVDQEFNYFATFDVLSKNGFKLGAGYAGRAENTKDKIVSTFTYNLGNLQRWIDVPIAQYIDPSIGIYAGLGNVQLLGDTDGNNEFDWGILANIVQIKF